ncbi:MAG: chorismate mutase [Spirochaetes bacterium]|nr:chorismate mutase [Spirochaetota bacterium]
MKTADECENMYEIREAIDSIDESIVKLIASRSDYVHAAVKFKTSENSVKDPDRVKKVIETKKALASEYGVSPELIGNIYSLMIDFFVSEEMKEWKRQ